MQQDDLDVILAAEDHILPSSGFTASVMEAVRRDTATPAPIPFPWSAALPGMGAALSVVVSLLLAFVHFARTSGPAVNSASAPVGEVLQTAVHFGLGWIALVLLLSLIAMASSMRIAGARV